MKPDVDARFQEDLLAWGEENQRDFPWRRSGANLYEVFIAEFFLTQTPADAVGEIYPKFVSRYPTVSAIELAEVDKLAELIEPLGLHNRRANALKKIADRVNGQLPKTAEGLESLPRVGPYIANATACIALDHQLPVVDTNVDRIYSRLFGSEWPASPDEQLDFAAALLPDDRARRYNIALIDFGAAVCTPYNPNCEGCFANSYCEFYNSSSELDSE